MTTNIPSMVDLSYALRPFIAVAGPRIIVEDYLAQPDQSRYIANHCVVCHTKNKSKVANLCVNHADICLMCKRSTGSKTRFVCMKCVQSGASWVNALSEKRCQIYHAWYGVTRFPSEIWPRIDASIKKEKRAAQEDALRKCMFIARQIMTPKDIRIAELTRKLYAANAIINDLRDKMHAMRGDPQIRALLELATERPIAPFF